MKLTFRPRSKPSAPSSPPGSTTICPPPPTPTRSHSSADVPPWARDFQAAMFDAGWLLPGQPPEFGGRNAPLLEQFVIQDELTSRRVYHSFNPQGIGIIAPSILMFGTPEQKQRWAVPLLRTEITAALGMSEPNAGSDLAGLRTRAVLDGDEFVVNGQKVWTSGAHDADLIFAFVRTDPDAPKHKGIERADHPDRLPRRHVPAVRLDHRPRRCRLQRGVPRRRRGPRREPRRRTPPGWKVATGALGEERAMLWLNQYERLEENIEHFRDGSAARRSPTIRSCRTGTARRSSTRPSLRLLGFRTVAESAQGTTGAQSILKLMGSETAQEATLNAFETLGPDYVLDRDRRIIEHEPWISTCSARVGSAATSARSR